MATKITFIGSKPAPTSGADVVGNGPISPAQLDQNFANLQKTADDAKAVTDSIVTGAGPDSIPKTDSSGNLLIGTTQNPVATRIVAGHTGAGYGLTVGDFATPSNSTGLYLRSTGQNAIAWDSNGFLAFLIGANECGRFDTARNFVPGADNFYSHGTAVKRISVVYAGTGTISTSDAREKTAVAPMTADEIAAAEDLAREIGTYQFLSSVAEKGERARHHAGMTVQRAIEVMQAHNLDPFRYGFICYDSWGDEFVDHPAIEADPENGIEAQPAWTEQVQAAGDRYSFRENERDAFILRGLAARQDEIEARLAALEGR